MKKNKILIVIPLILVAVFAYLYIDYARSQPPPSTPPQDTDTDGDGVPDCKFSFSVFQAEHISYTDGTDAWKYPASATTLQPYAPAPAAITDLDNGKRVQSIQTCVFFNIVSSKAVIKVDYVCQATIGIYNSAKQLTKTLGSSINIAQTVNNPQNATNTIVTTSTMTAAQFQSSAAPSGETRDDDMYFVLTLNDIGAGVTFSDGASKTFAATGVQATQNQLWWKFHVSQTGNVLQIANLGTEWGWN